MVMNVKHISTHVNCATKFTFKEIQEKKYSFLDIDVPNMFEELLKDK